MKFVLSLLFALPVVLAQEWQRKPCVTLQYQSDFYDTKHKSFGTLAVDFERKLAGIVFQISEITTRIVYNYAKNLAYNIIGEFCDYTEIDPEYAPDGPCLKDGAKLLAKGELTETHTKFSIYETAKRKVGNSRVVMTDGNPSYLLVQTTDHDGGSTQVFLNHSPKVNESYFEIPYNCVPGNRKV